MKIGILSKNSCWSGVVVLLRKIAYLNLTPDLFLFIYILSYLIGNLMFILFLD